MTTTLRTKDYAEWLSELYEIMRTTYGFSEETIDRYGAAENWDDYYNEDYSPLEAIQEDEELYWDQAA
jgi:hypothetical protein